MNRAEKALRAVADIEGEEEPEDCDFIEDAITAVCALIADSQTVKQDLEEDLEAWIGET